MRFSPIWLLAALTPAAPAQTGADYVLFGSGCASQFGVPTLEPLARSFPVIGETLTLRLSRLPATPFNAQALVLFGFSNTQWGPDALPLDLSRFGLLNCTGYVSVDAAFLVSSPTSTALFSLDIPNDPNLLGTRFFNQVLVQAPGANPFGAVVTNAGEGLVGDAPRTLQITEAFDDSSKRDERSSSGTWGNSRAVPGNLGGDGRHGSFDPTVGTQIALNTYRWDTDNTVIPGALTLSGQPETVTDGRFFFTDFVVDPGTTVEFTGSHPVQVSAWGEAEIFGTVTANAPDALPFVARPVGTLDPITGQRGGIGGPGGARGGSGADSGSGLGNQPLFDGSEGEDVRLPGGHAYLARAAGTGGGGSPQFPPSGLLMDITFNAFFGIRSGMVGAGGGGGGYSIPGDGGVAALTPSGDPRDLGPPSQGGNAIDLFADAQGSLPFGASSSEHFSVGGAGGGGGGSHPFLGNINNIPNPGAMWVAGAGGTGGGGVLIMRVGGGITVRPGASLQARGGRGISFTDLDDRFPMPGGGGSGGSILLQSDQLGGVVQAGSVDTSGGAGSTFAELGGQDFGGNGSPGFVRMETPDGSIQPGNTIPAGLVGGTGVLSDRDASTGQRSLWYATAEIRPFYLRYEVEAEIGGVPMLFSDDAAVSALSADDPNGPVHIMFQAARLDATGVPETGSIGPWRRYAGSASGQLETLNLDDGDAFRFQILFNRDVVQDIAVTRVSVFYY